MTNKEKLRRQAVELVITEKVNLGLQTMMNYLTADSDLHRSSKVKMSLGREGLLCL